MINKFIKKFTLRHAFIFLNLIVISFILLSVFIIYQILHEEPPQFFSLNDPNGIYKVTKSCPGGQGNTEKLSGEDRAYCIEYKGNLTGKFAGGENTNFFRITVGKSEVDLVPLLGKKVKNIKGKFVASNKQCIMNNCIEFGNMIVLNIDKLEILND